jgi:hypothetical protein
MPITSIYGDTDLPLAGPARAGDQTLSETIADRRSLVLIGDTGALAALAVGKDRIELNGFGFSSFQDLAGHLQGAPDGMMLVFDESSVILVEPAQALTARDCVFG